MTDGEKTILEAITEIVRFKALMNRVPGHALLREVKARTKDVKGLHAEDIVGSLARQGYVRTGATLNDRWCDLSHPLNHTDEMNTFEKTIKAFLDKKSSEDADFKAKYEAALAEPEEKGKRKKDVTACCNYIISEVRKTGRSGFDDAEIYGMALHFYDEKEVTAPDGNAQKGVQVVVNTKIELTKADKERIEKEAREKVEAEDRAKAEKKIRDEQEKARKREEEKARKAKEAAEAKKKEQEALGFGFLFGDDDFK